MAGHLVYGLGFWRRYMPFVTIAGQGLAIARPPTDPLFSQCLLASIGQSPLWRASPFENLEAGAVIEFAALSLDPFAARGMTRRPL
jgi:hypothetical protein